jgi:hypothetical protein
MKKLQSKSAEKFSIKVWLQKVNHLCTIAYHSLTTAGGSGAPFFNQSLLKIFQSRFDRK